MSNLFKSSPLDSSLPCKCRRASKNRLIIALNSDTKFMPKIGHEKQKKSEREKKITTKRPSVRIQLKAARTRCRFANWAHLAGALVSRKVYRSIEKMSQQSGPPGLCIFFLRSLPTFSTSSSPSFRRVCVIHQQFKKTSIISSSPNRLHFSASDRRVPQITRKRELSGVC